MRHAQFSVNELVHSFERKPVLSKAELLRQHGCSPATLWRLLRQVGYFTSYNYNAGFYTLADIPRFDEWGLWSYEDIRFSKWGTLPQTMVAVIEQSPAGMTAGEVAELLHVGNARPLLCKLAAGRRLRREAFDRGFVYLAAEASRCEQQLGCRRERAGTGQLPEPGHIIALLVEMIRHPRYRPGQWTRNLARQGISLDTEDVRAVMAQFDLSPKKGLWNA